MPANYSAPADTQWLDDQRRHEFAQQQEIARGMRQRPQPISDFRAMIFDAVLNPERDGDDS